MREPDFTAIVEPTATSATGTSRKAVAVLEQRRFRRELHERLHGLARAGEAEGFEHFREREEERHRRAFRPFDESPARRRRRPSSAHSCRARGAAKPAMPSARRTSRRQQSRWQKRHPPPRGENFIHCKSRPSPVKTPDTATEICRIRFAPSKSAASSPSRTAFIPVARDRADELLRRHALVVEKRDLSAHQIHPHFAHAFERPKHLLQRLDFIRAVHPGDAQRRLDTSRRILIQNGLVPSPPSPWPWSCASWACSCSCCMFFLGHRIESALALRSGDSSYFFFSSTSWECAQMQAYS